MRTLEKGLLSTPNSPGILKLLKEKGITRPYLVQDNAKPHIAYETQEWFRKHHVKVMKNWPPNSPDLNLIEHAWSPLKSLLKSHYPELSDMSGGAEKVKPVLLNALIHCWHLIPPSFFEILVRSMHRRVRAVIKARG